MIKKLNNNFAICVDGEDRQLIAYGKGIGFPKTPYEITDLNLIDRTFYDIDHKYFSLIAELSENILDFTAKLIDIARNELDYELNPNLVMTLADHINFSIQRAKQKIYVQMPLIYEIEQLYPNEAKLGRYAIKQLERKFALKLNANEASGIAINFVNARYNSKTKIDIGISLQMQYEDILEDTIGIVETEVGILIDRGSFNFARYSSHLMYLLQRLGCNSTLNANVDEMYNSLRNEVPKIAKCVELIDNYFSDNLKYHLDDEEKLYLLLHINRICSREGL